MNEADCFQIEVAKGKAQHVISYSSTEFTDADDSPFLPEIPLLRRIWNDGVQRRRCKLTALLLLFLDDYK